MIGQTVSHYRIFERIGEGGMGVVYKAEDTKLKRTVALKFLPPQLTKDPEAKKRFEREAQATAAFNHPTCPYSASLPFSACTSPPSGQASPFPNRLAKMLSRIEFLIVQIEVSLLVAPHSASLRRSYNSLQPWNSTTGRDLHSSVAVHSWAH